MSLTIRETLIRSQDGVIEEDEFLCIVGQVLKALKGWKTLERLVSTGQFKL